MSKLLLDSKFVFFVTFIISFITLLSDIAAKEFFAVFLFIVLAFFFDYYIENKTVVLFLTLITTNVLYSKIKYNRLKYYFLYFQKDPSGNPVDIPSYILQN